jgi:hypothetical protein
MENPYALRNKLYADLERLTELANENKNDNALVGVRINGADIVLVPKKDLPKLIESLKRIADQAYFKAASDGSGD